VEGQFDVLAAVQVFREGADLLRTLSNGAQAKLAANNSSAPVFGNRTKTEYWSFYGI